MSWEETVMSVSALLPCGHSELGLLALILLELGLVLPSALPSTSDHGRGPMHLHSEDLSSLATWFPSHHPAIGQLDHNFCGSSNHSPLVKTFSWPPSTVKIKSRLLSVTGKDLHPHTHLSHSAHSP